MILSTISTSVRTLRVSSKAFPEGGSIPRKYTCDGVNVSPPLDISFIPNETKSLAIIMEDPDAPISTWYHWLAWNVPVAHNIAEDGLHGIQGMNDFSKRFYCGPCPMSGIHQYKFRVFALDCFLELKPNVKIFEMELAMKDHILAYGELTCYYGRSYSLVKAENN